MEGHAEGKLTACSCERKGRMRARTRDEGKKGSAGANERIWHVPANRLRLAHSWKACGADTRRKRDFIT